MALNSQILNGQQQNSVFRIQARAKPISFQTFREGGNPKMPFLSPRFFIVLAVLSVPMSQALWAHDLRVTIPGRSELTPVQRLNREGVNAVDKHQYAKAEAFFYKAYLYDPADPFTLNNLGFISELQGELDRAQKFYALASEQGSRAVIDMSNSRQLEGKPMTYALTSLKGVPMRVNRMNVEAIELLSQRQNFEAYDLLRQALALEPMNAFTLNNLGVAEEATGDFENALKYYDAAAAFHSSEPIVVTLKRSSRGKLVSEVAAESARELQKKMRNIGNDEQHATMLALRGVAATNRNDWQTAKQDFLKAYSLNPESAFSLNNLGYVAERDGDLETAQFYYAKARKAADADARIGLATQRSAEGQQLFAVAADSGQHVDTQLDQYSQARRQEPGPIELIPRTNTPANSDAVPDSPTNVAPTSNSPIAAPKPPQSR
jgi:Flp pilus assembly protein TadD